MKNEQEIRAAYRDILGNETDPDLVRIVGRLTSDLSCAYKVDQPSQHLLSFVDEVVHKQAMEPTRGHKLLRRSPVAGRWPRQVGNLAACLLLAVMLAGAGYAALPVIEEAFNQQPSTREIIANNLGKELNVSQSVDGFTVTVKRVYANTQQIVIGYTISGPSDRTFNSFHYADLPYPPPALTDDERTEFHKGEGWSSALQDGTGGFVMTFSTRDVNITSSELRLHLEVPAIEAVEIIDPNDPPVASRIECDKGDNSLCFVTVQGPFKFDFTVPVE